MFSETIRHVAGDTLEIHATLDELPDGVSVEEARLVIPAVSVNVGEEDVELTIEAEKIVVLLPNLGSSPNGRDRQGLYELKGKDQAGHVWTIARGIFLLSPSKIEADV